jgi:hypothetical protein
MIKTENFQIDGQDFVRTYSDANKYVVRDGISYSEAIDPAEFNRVYTEGEEMPDEEIDETEIARILLGGGA